MTGGMKAIRDEEQERYRTGEMQDRRDSCIRDAGEKRCRIEAM